jgi:hypothetical protein
MDGIAQYLLCFQHLRIIILRIQVGGTSMDENDPERNEKTADQEPSPSEKVKDKHQEQTEQSQPAEQNAHDELCNWEDPSNRRIRKWCIQFRVGWKKAKFYEKCTLALTGIGLLVLIAYTVFTGMMWCANKKSADAAKSAADTAQKTLTNSIEAFRVDERAWVEIGKIEKTETYPPDQKFGEIFKFAIYPKNVGKTVARDVRISIENIGSDGSFADNKKAIRMTQDQQFREMATGKRIRIPDRPGPQTVAPGDLSPVPVYTSGEEPRRYGTIFTYTYLVGRIDYTDAFGTEHWKHICFIVINSRGDLGNCQYGNDEDNNPEILPRPEPGR